MFAESTTQRQTISRDQLGQDEGEKAKLEPTVLMKNQHLSPRALPEPSAHFYRQIDAALFSTAGATG